MFLTFPVPGSRRQIWWTAVAQGCAPLWTTWLRKDAYRAGRCNRKQPELPRGQGVRTYQDVCR